MNGILFGLFFFLFDYCVSQAWHRLVKVFTLHKTLCAKVRDTARPERLRILLPTVIFWSLFQRGSGSSGAAAVGVCYQILFYCRSLTPIIQVLIVLSNLWFHTIQPKCSAPHPWPSLNRSAVSNCSSVVSGWASTMSTFILPCCFWAVQLRLITWSLFINWWGKQSEASQNSWAYQKVKRTFNGQEQMRICFPIFETTNGLGRRGSSTWGNPVYFLMKFASSERRHSHQVEVFN